MTEGKLYIYTNIFKSHNNNKTNYTKVLATNVTCECKRGLYVYKARCCSKQDCTSEVLKVAEWLKVTRTRIGGHFEM